MAEVEPIIHLQQLIHHMEHGLTLHGSGPCQRGDHALRWSRELYVTRRSIVRPYVCWLSTCAIRSTVRVRAPWLARST
jgi:hypothetical protein